MNKSKFLNLLLILWFLPLFGCKVGFTGSENNIEDIIDPVKLPVDLQDEYIYFYKSNGASSDISICTLNLSKINNYQNHSYIPYVDVSDDGQIIVFAQIATGNRKRPFLLWKYNFKDDKERKIAWWDEDYSVISISNPVFSYDDKKILFSITWYETGKTGLASVDIDGKNLLILGTDIPLTEGPEPSPDGSMILVTCAGFDQLSGKPGFHICLLDNKGKFIRFISDRGDGHGSYNFTPDGKKIVYNEIELGGVFGIINRTKHRFYIYDLETGERTVLINWEVGVKGFSDDGQEIILEGRPNKKSPWGIYIINIDGTNLRHLTYFDEFLEDWYADIEDY